MPPTTGWATQPRPLQAPVAEIRPLCDDPPGSYAEAVEAYLSLGRDRRLLPAHLPDLPGHQPPQRGWWSGMQPPPGRARRGASPPAIAFTKLDNPAGTNRLVEAFSLRAALVDADTSPTPAAASYQCSNLQDHGPVLVRHRVVPVGVDQIQ